MIGKPCAGKLHARFEVAGDGKVLWRTYTGTKLETVDTAKGIPTVTRLPLTLQRYGVSLDLTDYSLNQQFQLFFYFFTQPLRQIGK